MPAFTPVILNVCLIAGAFFGQEYLDLPGNPFEFENTGTPSSMSLRFEEIATGFVGALLALKK